MIPSVNIRPRDRGTIIQALKAGVTPRTGLQFIQVGRKNEIESLINDINCIIDGGSTFRFVIGEFGSGKSFFLQTIRNIALEKRLVSLHADLAPDRRLQASGGQAINLYSELMSNCSTRTKTEGKALTSVIERFISESQKEADQNSVNVTSIINNKLSDLTELVGGYDFAKIIDAYWQGHDNSNNGLKLDAIRWLRGEFSTKTEAKKCLGVNTIIDDSNIYDFIKLFSKLVVQAGYKGLFITLDEMVNFYKLASKKSREANYEQILTIFNDCLQGQASYLGFALGGTPEFLMDTRKGLYSYEALQSRLMENAFARSAGVVDYSGPVLRLTNLTPEEMLILLRNIRRVFASGDDTKWLVPDEALTSFLNHCANRIGDAYFRTPRNTIKAFVDMLSVLEHDSTKQWTDLIIQSDVIKETNSDFPDIEITDSNEDDNLHLFRI
jgi:ABC-type dipeptide/oligopeptide/nickel transport system ATPase component